jgi:hypothetical protein
MGAFPFGGHPTFRQYLTWAIKAGCKVETGVGDTEDGRPVTVTIIVAPDGRKSTDVGTQYDDRLVPTTVARLDRQLGMKSPFTSLPDKPLP